MTGHDDDTALIEQIARASCGSPSDYEWRTSGEDNPGLRAITLQYAARLLPLVRKAQADALREAANAIDLEAIADEWSQVPGNSSDMHWAAGNAASTVQIQMFDRAREFEREQTNG